MNPLKIWFKNSKNIEICHNMSLKNISPSPSILLITQRAQARARARVETLFPGVCQIL
jgi:hypothetical protein